MRPCVRLPRAPVSASPSASSTGEFKPPCRPTVSRTSSGWPASWPSSPTRCASRSPTPAPTSSTRPGCERPRRGQRPEDAGEGIIYGNLDTGIWPEHPSFADQGNLSSPPGTARECNFGDNPLTPANDPFACNNKLIGGAPLPRRPTEPARARRAVPSPARDSDGHGTHTSSTSAGNVGRRAPVFGVQRGPVRGLAPGAWVAEYKVCGVAGLLRLRLGRGGRQAILDGVNVINFSISGGTDPFTDPVELAFLDAYAAGVFVAASAGNDGPGRLHGKPPRPVGDDGRRVDADARVRARPCTSTAGGGATLDLDGASITAGAGPPPIVLAAAAPLQQRAVRPRQRRLARSPARSSRASAATNGPRREGPQRLQGGAVGLCALQPGPGGCRDRQPLAARPSILRSGRQLLAFLAANRRDRRVRGGPEAQRAGRCHGVLLDRGGRPVPTSSPTSPRRAFRSWPGHTPFRGRRSPVAHPVRCSRR